MPRTEQMRIGFDEWATTIWGHRRVSGGPALRLALGARTNGPISIASGMFPNRFEPEGLPNGSWRFRWSLDTCFR